MFYKAKFNAIIGLVVIVGLFSCIASKPNRQLNNNKISTQWVGTWANAPMVTGVKDMPPAPGLEGNTLRQVFRISIGGSKIRLRFANTFGDAALTLNAVSIAYTSDSSGIVSKSNKSLTFNGQGYVTIPAGQEIYSDPLDFTLNPSSLLSATIQYGKVPAKLTGHPGSRTTSYLLSGDHINDNAFVGCAKTDHWYTIIGADVLTSANAATIACLGNSITDGSGSGTNKQNRWTDVLSKRLLANPSLQNYGVLNLGIGGNAVVKGGLGPTALARFDRDVLSQNGVKWLVLLEGVNDIGGLKSADDGPTLTQNLINAYITMIDKAHARGIKVYGCTILPFGKSFYDAPYRRVVRDSVNNWILNSGKFDAVIDFAKDMASPDDPEVILPDMQNNDHLHPNQAGYQKMGNFIDLGLFK